MSEFKNTRQYRIRWQLLATVSAIALLGSGTNEALAADNDRPPLWIEVDGQFSQQQTGQEAFLPPFMLASPFNGASQTEMEQGPPKIWDRGAKISFQPDGSDWILSLGIRYGKSNRNEVRDGHPTTANFTKYSGKHYTAYQNFAAQSSEGHTILDFQVGKDVGLGRFGSDGSSVISAGIRIAQFNARSHVVVKSQPTNTNAYNPYNKFYASFADKRKFSGIGPSLSWDASANLTGNLSVGSITVDWGVNGAVLFGRQSMAAQHQTSVQHWNYFHRTAGYHYSASPSRRKSVTVPNLGGFAGVSWRYADAKISFGYRADMFFGAIDGGIDARKSEDRGFYGPFAGISVGVGD
jgi:hypothetical protein